MIFILFIFSLKKKKHEIIIFSIYEHFLALLH